MEKYRALLEVQRNSHSTVRRKDSEPAACMSLQEELEMSGDFNGFQNTAPDAEIYQESTKSVNGNITRAKAENICGKKAFSATPTDFSEAETSSSGFSDETSNKATQTEGRPGSFLCSIADGEDCKFSIYDDNSPFESRFRKTPKCRQVFSEIFSVLKREAEAKDAGEKPPLLDDSMSSSASQQRSSILIQEDVASEITDDNQSVISSVLSSTVSEPLYRVRTPVLSNGTNEQQCNNDATNAQTRHAVNHGQRNGGRLDYLSINVTKKSTKKFASRKLAYNDRPVTPDVVPTANPKVVPTKSNSGGKKKFRPFMAADQNGMACNGYSYASRMKESPNSGRRSNSVYTRTSNNDQHNSSFEYRDYKPSTASEEVARLKRLEMSYAEVLRLPNKTKLSNHRRS